MLSKDPCYAHAVVNEAKSVLTQLRKGVLEYCVLALLQHGPSYGIDLAKRLGQHTALFASEGTLYPLLSRLRRQGWHIEIHDVFRNSTLMALAKGLQAREEEEWQVPPSLIPDDCTLITPEMLPLVSLSQEDIDRIVAHVPGGVANVQDIYPLVPLQEGVLFHHQLNRDNDAYVLPALLAFESRERFDAFVAAMDEVIARHDVLRTAIMWQDLPRAVQVVHRRAKLEVEAFNVEPGRDVLEQFQAYVDETPLGMELERPPLMRMKVAQRPGETGCYALLLMHHIIIDHVTLEVMLQEVAAEESGNLSGQSEPIPYRNFVAYSLAQLERSDAEAFFRDRLGDVDEPTTPFGLTDVHGDGRCVCGVGARGVVVGGDEAVERVVGREFAAQFCPQRRGEVFFVALGVAGGEQDFRQRVLAALAAQDGFDVGGHGFAGVGKEAGLCVVEGERVVARI